MASFVFINASYRPDKSESPAQRRQIRRQAMRNVAITRREKGTHGQHNRRQYPVFVTNPDFGESRSKPTPSRSVCHEDEDISNEAEMLQKIFPSLPVQGYERARIERGFDMLSLSALTSVHISRATVRALSSDRQRLRDFLQLRETSWLEFVPLQYHESSLVQAAVDCTLAQAQRLLCPQSRTTEAQALQLYGKALAELQAALKDGDQLARSEVLCATQILALYELLDSTQTERWLHHTYGAMKLIRLRGHQNYSTRLERRILLSQPYSHNGV